MNQFESPLSAPKQNSTNKFIWIALGGCLVLFLCMGLTAVLGIAGYIYYQETGIPQISGTQLTRDTIIAQRAENTETPVPAETATPAGRDTESPEATPTTTVTAVPLTTLDLPVPESIDQRPIPDRTWIDLNTLFETDYPTNDYFEPATRLGRQNLGERTVTAPAYRVGDTRSFYNGDTEIDATLMTITDHTYFWAETGLDLDQTAVANTAEQFESDYYPYIVNLFGDVWTPGIDNDPRFSVLNTSNGTEDELGRFNSTDEYPRTLFSQSNEQELIYMNLNALDLGSELYYGTLVHEMQHLIQWYVDPGEPLWVNEGLSQLAEIYVGLETADTYDYLDAPEIRLNSWDFDEDKVYAHYAGSYLFMVYLWEQLGEAAIQEFSRHPANGMAGIRAILAGFQPDRTLEQFVADWAVANYLDDVAAGPRFTYRSLDFRRPRFEEEVTAAPFETTVSLDQYGVHYYDLNDLRGETTLSFAGDTLVELTDAPPRSGSQMWYAPAVNEMNAQLTATFDLTSLERATLKYAVWYDLEVDYDFAYVSISTDGGTTWELLAPDNTTVGEFGPAYNGRSAAESDAGNGWLKENISLNAYVGRQVLIRFDVLTDRFDILTNSEYVAAGFALDDISIPELSYQTDVEAAADGWQTTGFTQVGWQLPQQWRLTLIEEGPEPQVTPLPLDAFNQGQWSIDIGKGGAVLVITPLTPFTDKTADYWLKIEQ